MAASIVFIQMQYIDSQVTYPIILPALTYRIHVDHIATDFLN